MKGEAASSCDGADCTRDGDAPEPRLDVYLERIGVEGGGVADESTLRAVLRGHVQNIPFENIDVFLERGIDLQVPTIFRKLVGDRRGGYCFESNGLLFWALRALGFEVSALSGRVRIGRPRDFIPARSHLFLRVELEGRSLLVDGGVGGLSPTAPLMLDEAVQVTPHEARRLVRVGAWDRWARRSPDAKVLHQALLGRDWQDVYEFTLEEMPEIDQVMANWYLTTHPASHFRDKLMVARAFDGGRITLLNRELTIRTLDGVETKKYVQDAATLAVVLEEFFGIESVDVEALDQRLPAA